MARVIQRDEVIEAHEGDLRIWWIRNVPNFPHLHLVRTPEEARKLLDELAEADLREPRVTSNAGGLEVYEGGEWHEWYDEDGNDINEEVSP